MRNAEKEDDRQQACRAESDNERYRRAAGAKRGMQIGQIGQRKSKAADDPGARKQSGDHVRRTGGTALQCVKDLADRLLIVIGGPRRDFGKLARADRLFVGRFGGGGRRGDLLGWGRKKVCRFSRTDRLLVLIVDVERLLDRRQRCFGWVRHFLRMIGHFGRRLASYP